MTYPPNTDPHRSTAAYIVFSILGCWNPGEMFLGLAEIARRLEMPITTAHRYCATLVDIGELVRDPSTRRYALTPWSLGWSDGAKVQLSAGELRSIAEATKGLTGKERLEIHESADLGLLLRWTMNGGKSAGVVVRKGARRFARGQRTIRVDSRELRLTGGGE